MQRENFLLFLLAACAATPGQTASSSTSTSGGSGGTSSGATFAWAKTNGDTGTAFWSAAADATGVVIAGALVGTAAANGVSVTASDPVLGNAYLVKYDTKGNAVWQILDTSTTGQSPSIFRCVAIDDDGDVVVGAVFGSNMTVLGHNLTAGAPTPSFGIAVLKFSSDGSTLKWASVISTSDLAYVDQIATDSSNDVIVSGPTTGVADFGNGQSVTTQESVNGGVFLALYNSSGVVEWAVQPSETPSGDQNSDIGAVNGAGQAFLGVGPDGSIYLAAGQENLDPSNNPEDTGGKIVINKYGVNGALSWSETATGTGGSAFAANDLTMDGSGNIIVSGTLGPESPTSSTRSATFGSTSLSQGGFVAEYAPSGALLWALGIDNNATGEVAPVFVATANSNVYVYTTNESGTVVYTVSDSGALQSADTLLITRSNVTAAAIASGTTAVYICGVVQLPATIGNISFSGNTSLSAGFVAQF